MDSTVLTILLFVVGYSLGSFAYVLGSNAWDSHTQRKKMKQIDEAFEETFGKYLNRR